MPEHINCISCGQGAPSLFLIVMAGEGMFQADVSVTADTGWENDMLWNTGERSTAKEFFEQVTKPLALSYGIDAAFVRSRDENGNPYESIPEAMSRKRKLAGTEEYPSIRYGLDIPMFGSQGGRLLQSCTSKWKIQAVNQEMRRRGAKTATTNLGIHLGEVHRLKPSKDGWRRHQWPLVDLRENEDHSIGEMQIGQKWDRGSIQLEMEKRHIPYLVTTECDGCPHKDLARWRRTSQETIDQLAVWEKEVGDGEFFLTVERKPLKEALADKERKEETKQISFLEDDSCDSGYCMIG
jgi:hypothetical protein